VIRVKLSSRGSGKDLNLSQFVGNDANSIDGCQFFVNSHVDEADVWFVMEQPDDDDLACRVPASRVFFLTAETAFPTGYYMDSPARMAYLEQFARVFTCHDVYLDTVTYELPFLPWMVNANHGPSVTAPHQRDLQFLQSLEVLDKPQALSVFCSTQTLTPTHRLRLRFVEQLKAHFGDQLHWYGNGVNPVAEKWEGLAPYRYSVVLENQASAHVITEKLMDAFLALCYPIYWGAPDVAEYFDARSFTTIDIKDLAGSIARIEALLGSDAYEQRLAAIRASRDLVLTKYHLYRRLARIAEESMAVAAVPDDVRLNLPAEPAAVGGWRGVLGRFR
jgi:hypothetical protein